MDFDQFEHEQQDKETSRTTTACFYETNRRNNADHSSDEVRHKTGTGSGGILDQFEEWEDFMQYGGAGRKIGFRVPSHTFD